MGGQCLRLLQAVHLLAAFNGKADLAAHARISIDEDGYLEPFLQRPQMGPFVIKQIKCDFGSRAYDQSMSGALEQHFLQRAQKL